MNNTDLIEEFYTSFQKGDATGMAKCYADHIEFEDPAFGTLQGKEVFSMWKMLLERGGSDLQIKFTDVVENEIGGSARWEATYLFGKKRRKVVNTIEALFVIRDGKIVQHIDQFSFWKWSRQALGITGLVLGWTSFLRNATRMRFRTLLTRYMEQTKPQA